ncbi:MAG: hypothetical protein HQL29_05365 [Candidatus Omnitrophica bacterium]|nr:hypothetical protein [Candidatus Omnitrophota bacterium]
MYKNKKLEKIRKIISSILVVTFATTSFDFLFAEEALKESKDTLAPFSRFSPIDTSDKLIIEHNEEFRHLISTLYRNKTAIIAAGEALHAKVSANVVAKYLERRLYLHDHFNINRTNIEKNGDGSLTLILKDITDRERVLRCFLFDKIKPLPNAIKIVLPGEKIFWVEEIVAQIEGKDGLSDKKTIKVYELGEEKAFNEVADIVRNLPPRKVGRELQNLCLV